MASNIEFVNYVCDQLRDAGHIECKRMFGEYGIYCDGKFIGCICDNQLLIKQSDPVRELLKDDIKEAAPYPGAKLYFLIDDLDNKERLTEIIQMSYKALPMQKTKKKKTLE